MSPLLSITPFSSVSLCTCLSQYGLFQYYYGKPEGNHRETIFTMEFDLLFITLVLNMSVAEWEWDVWWFEGL